MNNYRPKHRRPASSWRKAGSCSNGECVEVAARNGQIAIRDSKDPDGPILPFTADEWRTFLPGTKKGEFDQALTRIAGVCTILSFLLAVAIAIVACV